MIKVAVAGGFDPFHIGHLRHIQLAARLGNYLIVILARDDQLIKKKGYFFMPYAERKEILESIIGVSRVVQNIDSDITCNESLEYYQPNNFAKGGDRTPDNMPEAEKLACEKIGCKLIYGIGENIKSSSELVRNITNKARLIERRR